MTECDYKWCEEKFDKVFKIMDEREKQSLLRNKSMQSAIDVTTIEMGRRLEEGNHIKKEMKELQSHFATRSEVLAMFEKAELRIDTVRDRVDESSKTLATHIASSGGEKKWTDYLIMTIISGAVVSIFFLLRGS